MSSGHAPSGPNGRLGTPPDAGTGPAPFVGGTVQEVARPSPAWQAGLRPGDVITHVDGRPLTDIIEWSWQADAARIEVVVASGQGEPRETLLERDRSSKWGIRFRDEIFDSVRTCSNACAFCFVDQLPPGLRPSLYVRDDDYRLSFLHGNFLTLTNLERSDIERIIEQRLSPLYVSLHAVDPSTRLRLLCPTVEDRALPTLARLLSGGILVHAQIVLVPGVNDGERLDETLSWAARQQRIASVGVVPVGSTAHGRPVPRTYADPSAALEVLGLLRRWQAVMRVERGISWVQAADEFYLAAGADLPRWSEYDGFPQYDNGIGLARAFIDEVRDAVAVAREQRFPAAPPLQVTLVTGTLMAPVLERLRADLRLIGLDATVLPVRNSLFGGNVSVTGLLGRRDVEAAVRHAPAGLYLVPDVVVNSDGLMLDDLRHPGDPAEALSMATGKTVALVPSEGRGLVEWLVQLRNSS